MLISLHWINELLGGEPITADAVPMLLTGLGLEVEGIEQSTLPGVIVGEIREVSRHPKADRLSVVRLFDGTDEVQVVCGAGNLPGPGGKVAFAPSGTTLPGDFEIGSRTIRDVASSGMICSEAEMNIGGDADGILVLQTDADAGTPLTEIVPGIEDTVFELGITPNRPDALGHLGVARDLAAKLQRPFCPPEPPPVPDCPGRPNLVELDATARDRCGRYLGFALAGARVAESPLWLRVRLHRVGLRAINNAVDVTNFVLMECGQPIHAFDSDRLGEGRVVVRTASAAEPMMALDGSELELATTDLVIADAQRPQAVAGVMGGADSGVEDGTTNILLEVAWFQPRSVRATAKRLGLHSDSSHRFERGVDHGEGLDWTARRALALLAELTGAECRGKAEVSGELPEQPTIRFRPGRVEALLGMPVTADEAARTLTALGIEVERGEAEAWTCRPPTHRPDLEREVDLVEEVMRVHGLDDLPARFHRWLPGGEAPREDGLDRARALQDALRAQGFHEIVTFAFIEPEHLEPFAGETPPSSAVRLVNPMSRKQAVMRTHLLPRMLDCVAHNLAHHGRSLALFEVGRTYAWTDESGDFTGPTAHVDRQLPRERVRAGFLLAGRAPSQADPRHLIARAVAAGRRLGAELRPRPGRGRDYLHPGVQVCLFLGDREVGYVGEVHPDVLDRWDLADVHLVYGELDVDALVDAAEVSFKAIPAFPSTARDVSLDLPVSIAASVAVDHLGAAAAEVIGDGGDGIVELSPPSPATGPIEIVEDHRGRGVQPGRRALLLRLHYGVSDRTVTDAEVQPLHDEIVGKAVASLGDVAPDVRVR